MPIPSFPARHVRLALLAWGAIVFLWARLEESSPRGALIMGAGTVFITVGLWAWRETGGSTPSPRALMLAGAGLGGLIGLATPVTAAVLMLLKNGSHAHVVPDYPFGVMLGVLSLAPAYGLAGALIGVGLCALAVASRPWQDR